MRNVLTISALLAFTNFALAAPSSIPSSEAWSDFGASNQKSDSVPDTIDSAAIANHPLNQAFPPPDQSLVYSKSQAQDAAIKPVNIIDKDAALGSKPEDAPLATIIGDNTNLKAERISRVKELKTRKVYDYRDKIPSPFFQRERFVNTNKHLPGITYQADYSRLLFSAADMGDIGAISSLLERGADINVRLRESGITPLMVATKNGANNVVRYLVLRGADVNIADNEGNTALNIAAQRQDYQTIIFLLDNGANMNVLDANGKRPLDYLPDNQRASIIVSHLTTQAEFDEALLAFTTSGSYTGVSLALRRGARIDAQNKDGDTPLLIAACTGNMELVALILSHGANPLIANKDCMLAIDCATRCKDLELAKLIDTYTIKYELEHEVTRPKKPAGKHLKPSHHTKHKQVIVYKKTMNPPLNEPQICEEECMDTPKDSVMSFFERIKDSLSKAFSGVATEDTNSNIACEDSDPAQVSIHEKPLPKLDTDLGPDAPGSTPLAPRVILPQGIVD